MNFYESTSFGLRVTSYDLVSPTYKNLTIRLIPIMRLGEEKYFKDIEAHLETSGKILYEGIKMKPSKLRIKSLRTLAKRLDLVTQKNLNLKRFEEKIIHSDLDAQTTIQKWKRIPYLDRIKYSICFPIYLYFQDRTITRKKYAKYFMRSNEDINKIAAPMFDEKENVKEFYNEVRNIVIFKELDKIHNENIKIKTVISVVYGSSQMKSIFYYLSNRYKYKVLNGSFINVFSI